MPRPMISVIPPTADLSDTARKEIARKLDLAHGAIIRALNNLSDVKPRAAEYNERECPGSLQAALAEYNDRVDRLRHIGDEIAMLSDLIYLGPGCY